MRLTLQAIRVKAIPVSVDNVSDNTKRWRLAVGFIVLTIGRRAYDDAIYIPMLDGLSSDWTYQPDHVWTDPEVPTRWAGYPVHAEAK